MTTATEPVTAQLIIDGESRTSANGATSAVYSPERKIDWKKFSRSGTLSA